MKGDEGDNGAVYSGGDRILSDLMRACRVAVRDMTMEEPCQEGAKAGLESRNVITICVLSNIQG